MPDVMEDAWMAREGPGEDRHAFLTYFRLPKRLNKKYNLIPWTLVQSKNDNPFMALSSLCRNSFFILLSQRAQPGPCTKRATVLFGITVECALGYVALVQ
jgi:hypothetical protein